MITVAQGMVEALVHEGVSVVFGYPGAAICPFYDSLAGSPIHHVLVRQEQNAGHAASGYARVSGRPGVVVVTSGPGATNLITGLATAYMDSIPIVAITGQVSRDQIGRDVFQEADITGAAEPFTKYSWLVMDPTQIPRIMKEAFYIASSGRPGPVLIDIPIDVQKEMIEFNYPDTVNIRGYKPTVSGNPPQIRRVADAVMESYRPLICLGGGVLAAGAGGQVLSLAEQCQVPMVSTMMGLSAVPSGHPLFYGMLGMHGNSAANFAVHNADLLVIIGARAGDRAMTSPGVVEKRARVVHIDVDPAEIGKNVGAAIPLVGDAKNVVTQLLGCTGRCESAEWIRLLEEKRQAVRYDLSPRQGSVNPRVFVRGLSQQLSPDAVVAADVGQNQIWAANHLSFQNGRFLTSGGMGTMGYSVPAAVGAKFAAPGRQTVVICGDGSFQMQMNELATICQEGLDVKIVMMKNGRLGMVRELQQNQYGGTLSGIFLDGSPDFLKLAAAYGIPCARLSDEMDIPLAVSEMLQSEGPYLLECVVDPDESSI